jgi:proteasome lid subunit RPN8/RPN11
MTKKHGARVLLSSAAWKTILLDAYGRQEIEACGALLGRMDHAGNWHVEEASPLRNIYPSPVYFEFDPAELLALDLAQPGRMIGVYHSHPAGPALASSTDRQNMRRINVEQRIPWVWLIVSGPFATSSAGTPMAGNGKTGETTISARGIIAYYHYQDTGLQQIALQRSENDDAKPGQHQ